MGGFVWPTSTHSRGLRRMAGRAVMLIAMLAARLATEGVGEEMVSEAGELCPDIDMGPMRTWAPECLRVCPEMCTPLGHVHRAFTSSEKLRGVEAELCEHKKDFACYYEHEVECRSMGVEAEKIGVKLPETKAGLDERCL